MVIEIKNLRRPGQILDSAKLSDLGARVSIAIRNDTNGRFKVDPTVKGRKLLLSLKVFDEEKNKYKQASREMQNRLTARVVRFLAANNISADVKVV